MTFYRLFLVAVCFVFLPNQASAETMTGTVTSESNTGSTLTEEQQTERWNQRYLRAEGFRQQMLDTWRGLDLFAEYRQAYQRNRLEHATDCRLAQRKANKDGLFSVTARCFRTSLLMEREYWQKLSHQLETLPGISSPVRETVLEELGTMIEAIDAVIAGIDTNVYSTIEELTEAKHKLHAKYRKTTMEAVATARADRTATWLAHILVRLQNLGLELEEDAQTSLEQGVSCYMAIEQALLDAVESQSEDYDINLIVSQSLRQAGTCSEHLRNAYNSHIAAENGSETETQ